MRNGLGQVLRALAAVATGLMTAFTFPPAATTDLVWIGLVPLLVLARFTRPAVAFRWGFLAGLVFWLCSMFWFGSMTRTGGPWVWVWLGWLGLSAYAALYWGLFAMAAAGLWWPGKPGAGAEPEAVPEASSRGQVLRLLLTPLLWVGCEYARMTLFTGFSWNPLGVSLHANVAILQVASWGGVYAVSAVIVLLNTALALAGLRLWQRAVQRVPAGPRIQYELMIAFTVVVLLFVWGARTVRAWDRANSPATIQLRVAAIQGNIPQDSKWEGDPVDVFQRMVDLTDRALLSNPSLILWPETAVPFVLRNESLALERLGQLVPAGGGLLTGAIDVGTEGERSLYFNSALLIDAEGKIGASYAKQQLVPFGEFIPFESVLPVLSRLAPLGFSCTAGTTGTVFRLASPAVAFSALICFEDAMPGPSRQAVRNGADFLVNLTNDGWFEGSSEPLQHAAQAVFRAVENRVPLIRCANQGVTSFIDPMGRVDLATREIMGRGEAVRIEYRVDHITVRPAAGRERPPYARWGDWLFALPAALGTGIWLVVLLRNRRQTWAKQ